MSINYAVPLPNDQKGNSMQEYPAPASALAVYVNPTGTSSVITMNDNTTVIEVAAVGSGTHGGVIKWISRTDTAASVVSAGAGINFDHAIPAGTVRRFVVPIEIQGTSSIVGANKKNGLFNRYAIKAFPSPSASIFCTEY